MGKLIVVLNVGLYINSGEKCMVFKKQYNDKEVKCHKCNQKVKPIIQKNKLKQNFYGQRFTGNEKNYLLFCPNCKAIIGVK